MLSRKVHLVECLYKLTENCHPFRRHIRKLINFYLMHLTHINFVTFTKSSENMNVVANSKKNVGWLSCFEAFSLSSFKQMCLSEHMRSLKKIKAFYSLTLYLKVCLKFIVHKLTKNFKIFSGKEACSYNRLLNAGEISHY